MAQHRVSYFNICNMIGPKVLLGFLVCISFASACDVKADVVSDDAEGDDYIVGGRDAKPGQFPWIVSLRRIGNEHFCGGFILSERWVATSRNCARIFVPSRESMFVVTGAFTRFDGKHHRVADIILHPALEPAALTPNIAVIQTVHNIIFGGDIEPIRWPQSPFVDDGSPVFFAGWGYLQVSNYNGISFSVYTKSI